MKRTALRKKPRRGDNAKERHDYAETHTACACCRVNERAFGFWLETHHILNGKWGRVDHLNNFLRLCQTYNRDGCHQLATDNELTLAHCLWLKRETDSHLGQWDPEWIQQKMGRRIMPEPERPKCFVDK